MVLGCKTDTSAHQGQGTGRKQISKQSWTLIAKAIEHLSVMRFRFMGIIVKAHGRNTQQKRAKTVNKVSFKQYACKVTNGQPHLSPGSQGRRQLTDSCWLAGLVKLLRPPTIHLQPTFQYILLGFTKLIFNPFIKGQQGCVWTWQQQVLLL